MRIIQQPLKGTGVLSPVDATSRGVPAELIPRLNLRIARSLELLLRQASHKPKVSPKQTVVALLGLDRLAKCCGKEPFGPIAIKEEIFSNRDWIRGIEELGFLTWFTAVSCPERLEWLFDEFNFDNALANSEDGCEGRTIALSLLLAGIANAKLAWPETTLYLTDVAAEVYRRLQDNQGDKGIFAHAGAAPFPRRASLGRFGTFADQVWSIHALSLFGYAFDVKEPLEAALACGNSICDLQGSEGQWRAIYDKRTGRSVGRYSVVSLQLYASACSALQSLEETTGQGFKGPAFRGLAWITESIDLDAADGAAYRYKRSRSNESDGWRAKCRAAALRSLMPAPAGSSNVLGAGSDVNTEDLGLLLYSLADFGLPGPALSVANE